MQFYRFSQTLFLVTCSKNTAYSYRTVLALIMCTLIIVDVIALLDYILPVNHRTPMKYQSSDFIDHRSSTENTRDSQRNNGDHVRRQ